MRQIRFRGKRLDNGEWVYGDLCRPIMQGEETISIWCDLGIVPVAPGSIGQFTGLFDRNGKEIYEGDITTVRGNYPRVVLWDKVSWALMPCERYHDKHFWVMNLQHPEYDWWKKFADEIVVVGNIYDNPELLTPDFQ